MSQEELFINGDLLRLRREARGWALSDMAIRACMSVKQIRQLEEGGMSAFYSPAVKATAAKKVGDLLGISADEVLGHEVQEADVETVSQELLTAAESVSALQNVASEHSEPVYAPDEEPVVLTQGEEKKSKTSLWVIAGLFAAALAVAAYMQPKEEPASEPAPPLQVVPLEATDAASVADLPASHASSVDAVVGVPTPQKSASGLAGAAPVASAVRSASMASASAVPVVPASKAAP